MTSDGDDERRVDLVKTGYHFVQVKINECLTQIKMADAQGKQGDDHMLYVKP